MILRTKMIYHLAFLLHENAKCLRTTHPAEAKNYQFFAQALYDQIRPLMGKKDTYDDFERSIRNDL